jgi:hypothetical protein
MLNIAVLLDWLTVALHHEVQSRIVGFGVAGERWSRPIRA